MPERCAMELCPHWTGDGDVCACAVFGLPREDADPVGPPLIPQLRPSATGMVSVPGPVAQVTLGGSDAGEAAPPPGPYAQGGRSPIVWVLLCPACAGFVPQTAEDYQGFLSGQCGGCGAHVRERHRFRAWIDSAAGCHCTGSHPRVVGDIEFADAGASPTSHGGLQGGTPDSDSLSDARASILPRSGEAPHVQ